MKENISKVDDFFTHIIKPWWVPMKSITSTSDGQIHGLAWNSKVYIWHHSLAYAGKWVLHLTGR